MQRLTELFNVNTFIVSQVNPYVVPFISVDKNPVLQTAYQTRFVRTMKELTGNTIVYSFRQFESLGLLPAYIKGMINLIVQSYQGDVTVAPNVNFREYTKLLDNCNPEEYFKALP